MSQYSIDRCSVNCLRLIFLVPVILLLVTGMLIANEKSSKPINAANTCSALNLAGESGALHRSPFKALTPLQRDGSEVRKTSCSDLLKRVQFPGEDVISNLPAYQVDINRFFSNYCHRDVDNGWKYDIQVRDTGPYVQQIVDGDWNGREYGTHNAVVIWYSPEFYQFMEQRKAGKDAPMPEGAMAVKEMYKPPSTDCLGEDPINLKPTDAGIAFFIRHSEMSLDGWYWSWYGWAEYAAQVDDLKDRAAVDDYFAAVDENLARSQVWQPRNGRPGEATMEFGPGLGWGSECLDCHASAESYQTFADIKNITGGSEEDPINAYLLMNFPTSADPGLGKHADQGRSLQVPEMPVGKPASPPYAEAFLATFAPEGIFTGQFRGNQYTGSPPTDESVNHMPSSSFDSVWVKADKAHGQAGVSSQYVTSDQCRGCHDVGQTGVQFDMSENKPERNEFIDVAPYGTWRSSPMGLAGRDPIFFAQLASETQTFHNGEGVPELVENVCLGCHSIQGQRQYNLDHALNNDGDCGQFNRNMVDALPVANGEIRPADHPNYGALARDGISCTSCHHAVFKEQDIAGHFSDGTPDAQNKCVKERQEFINPGIGHTTLAASFTGSFLVGNTNEIAAQFESPKVKPMQNSLGLTPRQDGTFLDSDICGSCHTIHLPVLYDGKIVASVFEQTTYAEWAFSDFRVGTTANFQEGMGDLPSGRPAAGKLQVSCQRCHMESAPFGSQEGFPRELVFPNIDPEAQFVSKIATIQEKSNFPRADNTLRAEDIDLERRSGFARHTLVGLNVFFMSMAKQYPEVLGIPNDSQGYMPPDPSGKTINVPYIDRTIQQMQFSAKNQTATIAVESSRVENDILTTKVRIRNGVGHKFPSGVGFRRAFVEFRVLDAQGNTMWGSGTTNPAGVIMDNGASPSDAQPIAGELWWDNQCHASPDRLAFQPHFDTGERAITRQSQAQVYQELVMAPPAGYPLKPEIPGQEVVKNQAVDRCGTQLESNDDISVLYPGWSLTTSFLSRCAQAKDNRLLPQGYLPLEDRIAISRMFTTSPQYPPGENAEMLADKLAKDSGASGVGNDPDYYSEAGNVFGGGDLFEYAIPLADIAGTPYSVTARIYYQAIPPYYLQDRFCTASGDDRDRLYYLAGKIKLDNIADNWKLPIASNEAMVATH